ncbi:MAG: hypothetical protein AABX54_01330 [Nanoarchaeota archaeon]
MGYRVGRVDGEISGYGHKYIIVRVENATDKAGSDLVYYSHKIDRLGNPDFDEIARNFGLEDLENIVAVGIIDNAGGGAGFLGIWSSNDSRGAKKELMRNFEELLLKEYPGIEQAVNFCPDSVLDKE